QPVILHFFFFFLHNPSPTDIYTLSLHDALPICKMSITSDIIVGFPGETAADFRETVRLVEHVGYDSLYIFKYSERRRTPAAKLRSEEHTSELQSQSNLVCRLLLEKKKTKTKLTL